MQFQQKVKVTTMTAPRPSYAAPSESAPAAYTEPSIVPAGRMMASAGAQQDASTPYVGPVPHESIEVDPQARKQGLPARLKVPSAPLPLAPLMDMAPPQWLDAEEAVLGTMMTDEGCLEEALGRLNRADFYHVRHGYLFAVMASLHAAGVPVDEVTVRDRMEGIRCYDPESMAETTLWDVCGSHLIAVMTRKYIPSIEHTKYYIRAIRERSLQRQAIEVMKSALYIFHDTTMTPRERFAELQGLFASSGLRDIMNELHDMAQADTSYASDSATTSNGD